MASNRLQLNHAKTEVLWCTSSRRQHQIPSGPVRIGTTYVQPVSSTRDLGVYIDADMSMRTHVTAVVRACFAALRQIRSVRRSLSRHVLLTLVRALIVSKVDYCNSVLAGVPGQLQDRLQSVLNAAARLVFSAMRSERITPLRVTFRLCVLAYRCLHGTAPAYLAESLHRTSDDLTSTLDVVCALLTQPCWWYRPPDVQHSVTVPSQWLRHVHGTACRRLSGMHRRELKTALFRSSFDND